MAPASKQCRACGQQRLAHEFNRASKTDDGLAVRCRSCVNAARRSRDRQNKTGTARRVSIRKASRDADLDGVKRFFDALPAERRRQLLAFVLDHTVQDYRTVKKTARHTDLVRWLVDQGAKPLPYLVCEAAKGGNQQLVDALLASGASRTLHVAAAIGDVASVERTLRSDPSRASSVDDALDFDYGADRRERGGCTPLHYTAQSALGEAHEQSAGRLRDVARLLLAAGARVDGKDRSGMTPMTHAVDSGGNPQLVQVLIEHGARFQATHLGSAMRQLQRRDHGQRVVADMIWQSGVVDQEAVRKSGVHGHASQGMRKMVLWLLERGVHVDQRDESGRTALHWVAQRQSSPRMASLLLEHGATLALEDASGKTPLDLAIEHEKVKVAEFLRARAATDRRQ